MPDAPLLVHLLVDQPGKNAKGILSRIESKLDQLLKQVEALERRIAQLEKPPGRD